MRLEEHGSGSAVDWLRYAESDLEIARITQSSLILLEGLCFHAQQAAEKALKVVTLMPDLSLKLTPLLIDNRIDTVGINIVPIQFHTKPRSLRHQHMPVGVNILQFIRKFGRMDRRFRVLD